MAVAEVIELPSQGSSPDNIVEISASHPQLGRAMEITADVLVGVRTVGSVAVYRYIEQTPDYHSWALAGAFFGLAATDAIDGYFAKTGRRFQGKDESVRRPLKSWPDQLADKALADGTTLAIGKREEQNGNTAYGSVVTGAGIGFIARDAVVSVDRAVAEIQDIDTRAQASGKMKTLKQFGVITLALTPLAKHPVAKAALGAAFVYTAGESIESGADLHNHFSEQREAKRTAGQLPLQRWRAQRQAKKEKRAYYRSVAEDAIARKGINGGPRALRP